MQGVALESWTQMLAPPNGETVNARGLVSRDQVLAPLSWLVRIYCLTLSGAELRK
jgi:hypothetical protein